MTHNHSQSSQYFDRSLVPFLRQARTPSSENIIEAGVDASMKMMTHGANGLSGDVAMQSNSKEKLVVYDLSERPVTQRKYSSDEEVPSPMDDRDQHSISEYGSCDDEESASTFSDVASISDSLLSWSETSDEEDCVDVAVVEIIATGRPRVVSVPASPVTPEFFHESRPQIYEEDDYECEGEDECRPIEDCFIWPTIPERGSSRMSPSVTTMDNRYATIYRPMVRPPTTGPVLPNRYYGIELPHLAVPESRSRSTQVKTQSPQVPRGSPSLSSPSLSSLHAPSIDSASRLLRKPSLRAKFAPALFNRLSRTSDSERSPSFDMDSRDALYEISETDSAPIRSKMVARGASERLPSAVVPSYPQHLNLSFEWDDPTQFPSRSASMSTNKSSDERKRRSVASMLSLIR